jgi:hypothetical protein
MLCVGKPGVRIPAGKKGFFSPKYSDFFWNPPGLLSKDYQGLYSLRVKRPGRGISLVRRLGMSGAIYLPNLYVLESSALPLHLTYAVLGRDVLLSTLFPITLICVPLMISEPYLYTYCI